MTLAINALSAFDASLISEQQYRRLIEQHAQHYTAGGFQPLNLRGHHLLLSIDPDGVLQRDEGGRVVATLCNFEVVSVRPETLEA